MHTENKINVSCLSQMFMSLLRTHLIKIPYWLQPSVKSPLKSNNSSWDLLFGLEVITCFLMTSSSYSWWWVALFLVNYLRKKHNFRSTKTIQTNRRVFCCTQFWHPPSQKNTRYIIWSEVIQSENKIFTYSWHQHKRLKLFQTVPYTF